MNNKIPKFCRDCGTRLVWSVKESVGFDMSDGRQEFCQRLICPKKRWRQILHRNPSRRLAFDYTEPYFNMTKEIQ